MKPSLKSEIRAIVQFLFAEKVPPMEIRRRLVAMYDENVMLV